MKKYQYTPLLFRKHYGIICAVPTGKREYPKANENNAERKENRMGNEEMIAELNAQLMVKETRVRKLARLAGELPLMRSLAYQIRQLQVAKAAALAAR